METIVNVYRGNYFLIAFHLLLLGVLVYALVRIGRHPGPSVLFILASVLNLGAFFLGRFVPRDSNLNTLLMHVSNGGLFVASGLSFLAVFGWRRPDREGYEEGAEVRGLPPTFVPVRIPVAWPAIMTVSSILSLPAAFVLGAAAGESGEGSVLGVCLLLCLWALILILGMILPLEILHRAWRAIQDAHARTTPGKAVGYLFIPVYNVYWAYVAWVGLAKDFNAFTSRHALPTRRLSEGFFALQYVLALAGIVVGFIPVVGLIYSVVVGFCGLVVLWSVTGAVNDLYAAVLARRTGSPATPSIEAVPPPPPPESTDRAYAPPGYFG